MEMEMRGKDERGLFFPALNFKHGFKLNSADPCMTDYDRVIMRTGHELINSLLSLENEKILRTRLKYMLQSTYRDNLAMIQTL